MYTHKLNVKRGGTGGSSTIKHRCDAPFNSVVFIVSGVTIPDVTTAFSVMSLNCGKFRTISMHMIKKTALLVILAILFNALLFVFVWADRVFVVGLNPVVTLSVLLLFLLIATPLAVLAVKRLARYFKGKLSFNLATLFALGFFILLIGNYINELTFGPSTIDFQFQDTYVVIANVHMMIFLALIFLAFSAVYSFYHHIAGREMNAPMGYIHFGVTLVGICLLYRPVHYPGLASMPRPYTDYSNWTNRDLFVGTNTFKMKVTILLSCAQFLFIVNFFYSSVKGKKWKAI